MEKILGVDLGTNSIGLTLREDDHFTWYGVYTFRKGVGEGKSGEFSFAAERTKHRASRRLYNARRYRKWETLKILIENDFCPLKYENLDNWKNYQKGVGRIFPIHDQAFDRWIKLDFDGDGKPDFTSPYQLRKLLISKKLDLSVQINRHMVGRAFYHIAQRRGFKSSRKNGANEKTAVYSGSKETKTIGRNDYENLILQFGSIGAAFANLEDLGIRVRNRYTLRSDYQKEIQKIMAFQEIGNDLFEESVQKAIFYQRPLRSQKGLVGKCTLEPNKPRCPVSHPKFEEYRAWSFINNIKYKTKENEKFSPLPLKLKEQLFKDVFFFKSKKDLIFSDIRNYIKRNGDSSWVLNYKTNMDKISIPSCYVSARLKAAFGENWNSYKKTINRENKRGEYETRTFTIEEIWHILFSFEDEEYFLEFLYRDLNLNENQIKDLQVLFNNFPVGYANLSLKAINNILPFLREGFIYPEAVMLAKIPEALGRSTFNANKAEIVREIENEIQLNRYQSTLANITNNLIFKYYSLSFEERYAWKDTSYKLDEANYLEIKNTSIEHYGEKTWSNLDPSFKEDLLSDVAKKYQYFFSSLKRQHIRPPLMVNQIKEFLANQFNISQKQLEKIYHPSQIEIYPSKEGQKYLLSPKTAAFKNPMAYKALYKLRDVINHLIKIGKIDNDTRIVVEIARNLNDANKRWAIERYQRIREEENRSFAAAIEELVKEPNFKGNANPDNERDIDKFRLWTEQIEDYENISKEIDTIERSNKVSASSKDVMKYRLWKEQNCLCLYTGKTINLTDLFDVNKIDIEHTIPRSKSFDNSLANLTVCYSNYNRDIKGTKLPIELPNYNDTAYGYSAIKPRLESWEKRVNELLGQIDFWKNKSRRAADKPEKDHAIRQLHLRRMDYAYWKNKVDRFTRAEISQGFINSQMSDTQIISKYAYHFLKTVFNKVEVQSGTNTAEFRKIFGIQPKTTKKDRTKHSHHAIDAAVLTLIPSVKQRQEVLKKAYEYAETHYGQQYTEKPFAGFRNSEIHEIEKNILINHIAEKDQTLTPAKRLVRKRGRVLWVDKENKIPRIAQGDSVRGELHKQTYYGKIKIAAKNENGGLKRDAEGKVLYNQLNNKDEIWMVLRKPIEKINFSTDVIVDEHLATHLKNQINSGIKANELEDFQGRKVRRLRCRVKAARGFMNAENATIVKEQTYKSEKDYKNFIYADSGDNYLFALYKNSNGQKIIPKNILEVTRQTLNQNKEPKIAVFKVDEPVLIGRGQKQKEAELQHVFLTGQKIIIFFESKEELLDLEKEDLSKRLYTVKTLADAKQGLIQFQHHLEARSDEELTAAFPPSEFGQKGKNGFSNYNKDFIAPRLLLSPNNFNFIIEGKDFELSLDGSITFKY